MNGRALLGPGAGQGWAQTNFESKGAFTLHEMLDRPLPPAVTSDPDPSFPKSILDLLREGRNAVGAKAGCSSALAGGSRAKRNSLGSFSSPAHVVLC